MSAKEISGMPGTYDPGTPADWAVPRPRSISDALDILAHLIAGLGGAPGLSFIWTPTIPGQTGPIAFTSLVALETAAIATGQDAASEVVVFLPAAATFAQPTTVTIPPNQTWRRSGAGLPCAIQFGDGVHILGFMPADMEGVSFVCTKTGADNTPVYTTPGASGVQQTIRMRGLGTSVDGSAANAPTPFHFTSAGDQQLVRCDDESLLGGAATGFASQLGGTVAFEMHDNSETASAGAVANAGAASFALYDQSSVGNGTVIGSNPTVQVASPGVTLGTAFQSFATYADHVARPGFSQTVNPRPSDAGTASVGYTNLATPGPSGSCVVGPSGKVLVSVSAQVFGSGGGGEAAVLGVEIDATDPSTTDPRDATYPAPMVGNPPAPVAWGTVGSTNAGHIDFDDAEIDGIPPGPHTFTLRYAARAGSGAQFMARTLSVQPL